jgi:hypothetical protein
VTKWSLEPPRKRIQGRVAERLLNSSDGATTRRPPVAFATWRERTLLSGTTPPATPVLALVPVETDFDAVMEAGITIQAHTAVALQHPNLIGGQREPLPCEARRHSGPALTVSRWRAASLAASTFWESRWRE